jgi:hypothetical protein
MGEKPGQGQNGGVNVSGSIGSVGGDINNGLDKAGGRRVLREELARLKNDHPTVAAISNEAVSLIDNGDLASARTYWNKNRDAILENIGATPEMVERFEAMNKRFIQLLES